MMGQSLAAPAVARATTARSAGSQNPAPRPRRNWAHTRASGFALILVLLALWEASSRLGWVQGQSWPPFSAVLVAAWRGTLGGELSLPLLSTIGRMLAGYAIGCSLGVALGLLLGANRWIRWIVLPVVEMIRPIPIPAIVPPLILFLGIDDALKVFVVALASFFPALINTMAGVLGVDDVLLQTARTFRVGWSRTVLRVVLPATLPAIASGLRVAIGLALVVTVVAEMIAGSAGIGYYIVQMQYALRPDAMYAAVLCLAVTGYVLNRLFLIGEARLMPWMGRG
ncbi:ABC transporter permease [Enterovirga aerilata]|uniref:ABC transporter permease n=1 Tax=Enterovirga aerilata TaxID=2730920 RepID=A0A849I4F7_9HYPH|nr:ABC transporter permease [Enterovirga sp. DB1703]NNM72574.1 ABC transporter permease [Enterovirga sp. DB1703]